MREDLEYKVLINKEGQHSIWPETKAAPLGWEEVGPCGSKEEILEWIKDKWTDIRPASISMKYPNSSNKPD